MTGHLYVCVCVCVCVCVWCVCVYFNLIFSLSSQSDDAISFCLSNRCNGDFVRADRLLLCLSSNGDSLLCCFSSNGDFVRADRLSDITGIYSVGCVDDPMRIFVCVFVYVGACVCIVF
eukprot:GHVR01050727.1.p1 GENE.GHVR01050727.1~~GHVR01050727.1.p1  ORF type:complete len:118 (-),score=44.54 GHVR01050727.1:207-560(-)